MFRKSLHMQGLRENNHSLHFLFQAVDWCNWPLGRGQVLISLQEKVNVKTISFRFVYNDGTPFPFSWWPYQPNNGRGQEHCVHYASSSNVPSPFLDITCGSLATLICQVDPKPYPVQHQGRHPTPPSDIGRAVSNLLLNAIASAYGRSSGGRITINQMLRQTPTPPTDIGRAVSNLLLNAIASAHGRNSGGEITINQLPQQSPTPPSGIGYGSSSM